MGIFDRYNTPNIHPLTDENVQRAVCLYSVPYLNAAGQRQQQQQWPSDSSPAQMHAFFIEHHGWLQELARTPSDPDQPFMLVGLAFNLDQPLHGHMRFEYAKELDKVSRPHVAIVYQGKDGGGVELTVRPDDGMCNLTLTQVNLRVMGWATNGGSFDYTLPVRHIHVTPLQQFILG